MLLDVVGMALVAAGAVVAVWAARRWWKGRTPDGNLLWMRTFRAVVFGASIATTGAGLWLGRPALVALGIVVGLEETIESSIAVWALKQEKELEARYPLPARR